MEIPYSIRNIIGDRPYSVDCVGMSDAQVICFEDMVLKIGPEREESVNEFRMMEWLAGRLPVPEVLSYVCQDGRCYLLMSRIDGVMACDGQMLEQPKRLVKLLAEGLRMLWTVDISHCPSDNRLDRKLKCAEARVLNGLCSIEDAEPDTYGPGGFESPKQLLRWLKEHKPVEDPVFSHGDYCLPNVFFKDGKVNGFIDLGRSGIGGRYQDIALCCRSLQHNTAGCYGGKVYDEAFDLSAFFEELQMKPDYDKVKYYILLDELF
ncbi:APH(3') family aminoglycoside O-phosphotransferase [Lachnotalea sp. AF33-28]|uniref:APH(3') family aminoglycoside O-phosphotransferase n=1 Tax=Lachnotalea sp. AF33-28 TaxID=2292046 RepID=UPI0013141994|nr:APH(3') family aminoglycoside O-phosphotransferase [Lachnotalea sp. AF33-28]